MSAPQFITLRDGTILNTVSICRIVREGTSILFYLTDGTPPLSETYATINLAFQAFTIYLATLNPSSTFSGALMQMMYGTTDVPTLDPPNPALPAMYRGRTNNTVYVWDTQEGAWFPVVSV